MHGLEGLLRRPCRPEASSDATVPLLASYGCGAVMVKSADIDSIVVAFADPRHERNRVDIVSQLSTGANDGREMIGAAPARLSYCWT